MKVRAKTKAAPAPPLETRVAVPVGPGVWAKIATVLFPLIVLAGVGWGCYRIGYEQGAIYELHNFISWETGK